MTPESEILRSILQYLKLRGVFAWRVNTGAMKIPGAPGKRERFIRFGFPGVSDIIGILDDGRLLAVEVKSATGQATADQLIFLAEVAKRGGVAFVARSIEDVDTHIFQIGYGAEYFKERP